MSRVGWIRLAVIGTAIGLLEISCRLGLIDHRVVIAPSEMVDALVQLLISGQANDQIARTFGIVRQLSIDPVGHGEMHAMHRLQTSARTT